MDDGKLHKVANVAGQTMALHPHGDAAITDALTHMANKGFLLDRQGNFGNLYTGDPAAASRYIETRLSQLAKEALFNPDLMEFIPAYDGRRDEPVRLSAKIPLILLQGVDGIAVGKWRPIIEGPVETISLKGVSAKGIRLASRPVSRMTMGKEQKELF